MKTPKSKSGLRPIETRCLSKSRHVEEVISSDYSRYVGQCTLMFSTTFTCPYHADCFTLIAAARQGSHREA
jgi:hypothetical protein